MNTKLRAPTFPLLAPSLIAADLLCLEQEIRNCQEMGLSWLHCDVMDGHFVPNLTIGPDLISAIKKRFPTLICDCHLMVSQPDVWIPRFVSAQADIITVHVESISDIGHVREVCHRAGVAFGLSLRPSTSIDAILPYVSDIDLVLVMSVEPGFYGQAYISGSEQRIRAIRQKSGKKLWVGVDGGVNPDNAELLVASGADILVAGGAFFKAEDREGVLKRFQTAWSKVSR